MPAAASDDASMLHGRRRVVVDAVLPVVDGGRFPVKRCTDETLTVEAHLFADGHDAVAGVLLHRRAGASRWNETPLRFLDNDRWQATFATSELGRYEYCVEGWVDHFATWRRDLGKRVAAGQDVAVELLVGAGLVADAARRATGEDAEALEDLAARLSDESTPAGRRAELALDPERTAVVDRWPDRTQATRYDLVLEVQVDPPRARFSAWYELFPRSWGPEGKHGTFRDVAERLGYVSKLGFDVLYLPPIHPIGRTHRKGRNNARTAKPGDVGSPWAIGAEEGGHDAVHPDLGTLEDFRALVKRASELGLQVALDVAYQCSPDHPWVKEHPEWFRQRPDGTLRHAENPPKKYEDIYPIDFESEDWEALWTELKRVVLFWIEQGVTIFRVDNPHTKAFPFWAWLISEVKSAHPETLFLAEAFTRPKVMHRLAKLGFSQSYTYFAWRNEKHELTEYMTELTTPPAVDYFRPNFWPNTPDILTEVLQTGGRPAFALRLLLAATLTASYGIYGPAYELCENVPREPGSEEYLDSEKYQLRSWNLKAPHSLQALVTRLNAVRRSCPALQRNETLRFHAADNPELICYSKVWSDPDDIVLVVANLDPHHVQSGWIDLDLDVLGLPADQAFQVHDLLSESRYLWHGPRNYVELNPHVLPAHVFSVRQRARTEQDFEYYA